MNRTKLDHIRNALTKRDTDLASTAVDWPWLTEAQMLDKRRANKFMLGAIVDYQVPANQAWENARRFAEDSLNDPDDLWLEIVERWTEDQWNSRSAWKECALHRRFPAGHNRVRTVGLDILRQYDGDSRSIWQGQHPEEVLCRLDRL